jgi:ferredoxin
MCASICPTDCIDIRNRTVDNERCVRCLNCVSLCPKGSIGFSWRPYGRGSVASASRREFLVKGAAVVLGVSTAGHVLGGSIRALARTGKDYAGVIFPPGALDVERFARTCTSCQMCAINCPASIIEPSYAFGPVFLNYANAGCRDDCTRCNTICPSGALRQLALEDKKLLRIGEALFEMPLCRVSKENVQCDLCAKACPKGAIFMVDGPAGLQIPEVNAFHCIGCGNCEAVCPVRPKAIRVRGIEQRMMGFEGKAF